MLQRKVLIILILLIVLTGCTKVVNETVINQDNIEPTSFENVDISTVPEGCVTWFDGCNTCLILDNQIVGCTEMYCETLLESECQQWEE